MGWMGWMGRKGRNGSGLGGQPPSTFHSVLGAAFLESSAGKERAMVARNGNGKLRVTYFFYVLFYLIFYYIFFPAVTNGYVPAGRLNRR